MLYLKNSLVNLTIILFSLFFLTISLADDNNFIFPKKKIVIIKTDNKKINTIETGINLKLDNLPQKNPLREKVSLQKKVDASEFVSKEKINGVKSTNTSLKKTTTQNSIEVKKTNGTKCNRCWKILEKNCIRCEKAILRN